MSPAKKATSGRSGAASKAKKSTATKTAPKKSTATKTAPKKTAAKKTAAKKTAAKKTAAKKTAAKKTAAKKTAAKKTAVKKTSARAVPKQVAKKTPATKVAAKKTPAKAPAKPQVARKTIPSPKKKVRPAKFTSDQLKKIKNSLVDKKAQLEARQKELEETSFVGTQSDMTGEVGIDEDFADSGTATFERERDLSIRNNIRDLIDQVTRAIERIEERTYGTCERCGQPIDATRLRELSHASLCLDCKRREERAR